MKNLISVDKCLELVIPQKFNDSIFGEDQPTYPCFEIKVEKKESYWSYAANIHTMN